MKPDLTRLIIELKALANDPPRIQREVETYKAMIPELTKKIAEVEPKTRLLREIDVSFQRFLRRDDSLSYSANQSVSDLKELFNHVKVCKSCEQLTNFFSIP
jgi:hypothetical protein